MAKIELKYTFFWTRSGVDDERSRNLNVHSQLARKAKSLLAEYDIGVRLNPADRNANHVLPWGKEFSEETEYDEKQQAGELRNLAHKIYPGDNNDRSGLVVIYCPFADVKLQYDTQPSQTGGITFGWNKTYTQRVPVDGVDWLPFIVINTRHLFSDAGTLVHEAGHAAGNDHLFRDGENVMSYGKNRSKFNEEQLEKLKQAYFVGSGA